MNETSIFCDRKRLCKRESSGPCVTEAAREPPVDSRAGTWKTRQIAGTAVSLIIGPADYTRCLPGDVRDYATVLHKYDRFSRRDAPHVTCYAGVTALLTSTQLPVPRYESLDRGQHFRRLLKRSLIAPRTSRKRSPPFPGSHVETVTSLDAHACTC